MIIIIYARQTTTTTTTIRIGKTTIVSAAENDNTNDNVRRGHTIKAVIVIYTYYGRVFRISIAVFFRPAPAPGRTNEADIRTTASVFLSVYGDVYTSRGK